MLLWLFRSIKGYVRICLKDGSPERFLNLCSARGFKIWNIVCRDKGEYEAYMTVADVRRVKPLVRKSGVRLRITGRFGFPFFIFSTTLSHAADIFHGLCMISLSQPFSPPERLIPPINTF